MKNLAMFLIFIVFGTVGLVAQEKGQIKDQDRDRDRIIKIDGDILQITDRDQIRLKDKITLNDGTVVNPDGTYITRDKDRFRLRNGSCIDMDGVLYRNEYQYQYKVKRENKGLQDTQIQERTRNRYHIMNIDGQLYQIRNQSQNQLKKPYKLSNRVVVNPDGTYTNRNGQQVHLRDGECLNLDGQMFKNTYMHRKMVNQKNMNANKTMTQKKIQTKSDKKENLKKGQGN
ncbi:MAG: hypothetical protein Q7T92_06395 [Lutibacter sp.]|nr:hypothetical protein [Lutibacter sp.]